MGIFGIFRILEGRFARFGRFSRIGLHSRRGPAPILENRARFSKIPKNRPLILGEVQSRFSRIEPYSRRFPRIDLDSRRGPVPILENRSLFSRISFDSSRIGSDSRESGLGLPENQCLFLGIFENKVRFSRIGTGPLQESRSILENLPNLANLPSKIRKIPKIPKNRP